MNHLVNAVRKYAIDHYEEDGWDYVVECWMDGDILEVIEDAETPAQAIKRVRAVIKPLDEYRRDIQASAF